MSAVAPDVTYTPNADYNGSDSFTYQVNDGMADSNVATVSITVNPANDMPVAGNQLVTTDEDTGLALTLAGSDVDGDPLTFTVLSGPASGTLSGVAPDVTYTPNADTYGSDSFTYQVNNGLADSNIAAVSITVNPVNDGPVALDDGASMSPGTEAAIDVLGNDTDVDGDALSVNGVTQGANGVVTTDGNVVTYTPVAGFTGADGFTYTLSDGALTDTASVSVSVIPAVAITIDDVSVGEGDAGAAMAVFTVSLSAASELAVSVDYATTDGTAQGGSDYTTTSGTLIVPVGAVTQTLAVEIVGDLSDEPDEMFLIQLSNPLHATLADPEGAGTILNDDPPEISVDDVSVVEGGKGKVEALFTVSLSSPPDKEITLRYRALPDTATADVDFGSSSETAEIKANKTEKTLRLRVRGDRLFEPDETFFVELSQPSGGRIVDGLGVGTIVDDEACLGPNLLVNPGAEDALAGGELPGWTEVLGTEWRSRFAEPLPLEGAAYFSAGSEAVAELRQDIDVSAYAGAIDTGTQVFSFQSFVRTFDQVPANTARIIIEYRTRANDLVLDRFDSGELSNALAWESVADERVAPVDTGWIRVRLLATRYSLGTQNDAYFDGLSLQSARIPVLSIADQAVLESDAGMDSALFPVSLSCSVG